MSNNKIIIPRIIRQGRSNEVMNKLKFKKSSECDYGIGIQSTQHLILNCQLRRYDGDLEEFIKVTTEVV